MKSKEQKHKENLAKHNYDNKFFVKQEDMIFIENIHDKEKDTEVITKEEKYLKYQKRNTK